MKKGEVSNTIYETLKPMLAPSDFRLNKSQVGFVRPIVGGTQTLGVPLWDYNPKFEFSLNLTCRLHAAQAITNPFHGSPPKYHSITQTVLTQLEHLGLRNCRWQAETESDLELKLSEVGSVVRDAVIPFFQQYRDLSTIAAAANPAEAPVVPPTGNGMTTGIGILADRVLFSSGNHPYRAMSAITLAYLAHFTNFEALVSRYQKELSALHHQGERDKFDKLVQFLRGHAKAV